MNFETDNIEFKAQFTEEIYKEVIAFANTDGGVVFVGIDNDGNAVGLTDVDQEYTRITNGHPRRYCAGRYDVRALFNPG